MTVHEKYLELITHHATAIYDQHAESEFAYFYAWQEIKELEERFSKEVAKDIYMKVIDMARADNFVNKNGVPYLQGGKVEYSIDNNSMDQGGYIWIKG